VRLLVAAFVGQAKVANGGADSRRQTIDIAATNVYMRPRLLKMIEAGAG
jgi:hypothetical protein